MTTPRDVLVAVLSDVAEADVPEDLRRIAFDKLWDAHTGSSPAVSSASRSGATSPVHGATAPADTGDKLNAIAARANLDRDVVAEVFDERGGELELIIGAGKLSSSVSSGAKEIALLVAGSRQAAAIEEWTALDSIRDVCQEFKKLDSNFARTIQSMTSSFNVRKESERKLMFRVSRPGWEEFGKLVARLAGA